VSELAESSPPSAEDGGNAAAPSPEPGPDREEAIGVEGLIEALRQARVGELLLSTVSTLASVAYGKLEAADLPEAKVAIDAVGALLPLLSGELDDGIVRELEQALTALRLAYADAVSAAQ